MLQNHLHPQCLWRLNTVLMAALCRFLLQVESAVSNARNCWQQEITSLPEFKAHLQAKKQEWEKQQEENIALQVQKTFLRPVLRSGSDPEFACADCGQYCPWGWRIVHRFALAGRVLRSIVFLVSLHKVVEKSIVRQIFSHTTVNHFLRTPLAFCR